MHREEQIGRLSRMKQRRDTCEHPIDQSVLLDKIEAEKQRHLQKSPMLQFMALSKKFDEEQRLEPPRPDRVKFIYQRFEREAKRVDEIGADMTKQQQHMKQLRDILVNTSKMNIVDAENDYNDFVRDTEKRINSIVYRLQHHYNLNTKLNSIAKQSRLTRKTFDEQRHREQAKRSRPAPAKTHAAPSSQAYGNVMANLMGEIASTVEDDRKYLKNSKKPRSFSEACAPYAKLQR